MFKRTRAYPTNPWVDWERERSLNFHDSVFVSVFLRHSELVFVFPANAIVSQVCAWSRSVQVHPVVGMTKLALFHDQRDRIRFALTMCCSCWNCLPFMVHSTRCHRWISSVFQTILVSTCFTSDKGLFACADSHALHPGVGVRLSRTSTSSPSGLRHEGVALSLMTSEPLFSFSTHRRTVLARTTCPISFTTRCSSLSSVRPTHIDRNVRGGPFATTRTPPGVRSDGVKHSTIANNGRIGDLYGLPVRRSNDVALPVCG